MNVASPIIQLNKTDLIDFHCSECKSKSCSNDADRVHHTREDVIMPGDELLRMRPYLLLFLPVVVPIGQQGLIRSHFRSLSSFPNGTTLSHNEQVVLSERASGWGVITFTSEERKNKKTRSSQDAFLSSGTPNWLSKEHATTGENWFPLNDLFPSFLLSCFPEGSRRKVFTHW